MLKDNVDEDELNNRMVYYKCFINTSNVHNLLLRTRRRVCLCMTTLMFLHATGVVESLPARGAGVGCLPCMRSHVNSEVPVEGKRLPTDTTHIRFLARMYSHMILDMVRLREASTANCANVGLLTGMSTEVRFQ